MDLLSHVYSCLSLLNLTLSTSLTNIRKNLNMPKVGNQPAKSNPKKTTSKSKKEGSSSTSSQTKKSSPNGKVESPKQQVIYPKLEMRLFSAQAVEGWEDTTPLSGAIAKELLQWEELPDNAKNFLLVDLYGKKIVCKANMDNRPFYIQLAQDNKLEVLRKKWKFNFETIKVGEYGNIHDGQHRLIGLILAIQEWELDQKKEEPQRKWSDWEHEPYLEAFVGLGMKEDDETVNTINTGKIRSDVDVLYRSEWLKGKADSTKMKMAKGLALAVKFVWSRSNQAYSSLAPRRPHSELFDFLNRHKRLEKAVQFIYDEADNTKLEEWIPIGKAAGLLYLMGSAASDVEAYQVTNDESALEWKLWDQAEEFWTDLCSNGKATEVLREALLAIPVELKGNYVNQLKLCYIIKAWNLFSDKKKITLEGIDVEEGLNELEQKVIEEDPRCGGIDLVREEEPEEEEEVQPEEVAIHEPAKKGECPKGGKHKWVKDGSETYCEACLEPKKGKK